MWDNQKYAYFRIKIMKWFYKKIIKWWNDQYLILNNFYFNNIFVRCSEVCIFPHLNYEMIVQKIIKWWNDQFLILNNFHYNNIFVRQSEVCLFLNLRLKSWNTHTHTHIHNSDFPLPKIWSDLPEQYSSTGQLIWLPPEN